MNWAAFDAPRRGLAAAPAMLAVCSEMRPPAGFAEQGGLLAIGLATRFGGAGQAASSDVDSLARIIEELACSGAAGQTMLTELLGLTSGRILCPLTQENVRRSTHKS